MGTGGYCLCVSGQVGFLEDIIGGLPVSIGTWVVYSDGLSWMSQAEL